MKRKTLMKLGGVMGTLIVLSILVVALMELFSNVERNVSTNQFLADYYWLFLVVRLGSYGVVGLFAYRAACLLKRKNPGSLRPFVVMSVACILFVLFNEITLFMRLLG